MLRERPIPRDAREAAYSGRARQTPSWTRSPTLAPLQPHRTVMASSSVHLALAAIAGITLGAGATLALRPEPKPSSETSPTSPVGVPARQGKKDKPLFPLPGGPERVYYGPVTGAQIVNRELSQLGSVGQSPLGSAPFLGEGAAFSAQYTRARSQAAGRFGLLSPR